VNDLGLEAADAEDVDRGEFGGGWWAGEDRCGCDEGIFAVAWVLGRQRIRSKGLKVEVRGRINSRPR